MNAFTPEASDVTDSATATTAVGGFASDGANSPAQPRGIQ